MAYRLFAGLAALLTAALLLAWPAQAFERPIPPEARRGELTIVQHPDVRIDGKPRRLSPGARIRDADNLIVIPSALGEKRYAVYYTEDIQGEIDRVWILGRDEANRAGPPAPRQN